MRFSAAHLSLLCLFATRVAVAQEHQHPQPPAGEHQHGSMSGHQHDHAMGQGSNKAVDFLLSESSGTALQPRAWPMPMLMNGLGQWKFMWMGQAFLADTQQSGPRGGDKLYSANWAMLGAVRSLGQGAMMIRLMPTLEPLTITDRRYPLLFQTGESAFGKPLVDAQHPHELIMEFSAQYAHPIGSKGMFNIYYAPVGDPALGPVAFPHRASAMEFPQATLAHHWQDSTHIANNVLTVAAGTDKVRLEGSGFRGREPNENRWNIDFGAMDSWSGRLSVFPAKTWMAQVSAGRLKTPEEFHPDDVVRTTASLHHILPRAGNNWLASSFIWARNYKTIEKRATQAVVAETVIPVARKNFFLGRFEWSQRDELFENDHDLAHEIEEQTGKQAFNVTGFTFGYTRDIGTFRNAQTGLGANFTQYAIAKEIRPYYGDYPRAVTFFLRLRLKQSE
jgi:hypothetical protein